MPVTTGEKIAALRRENGINQEELAEKLGISRQAVSKWEAGAAEPSVENYRELGRVFGVPVDELLEPDAERALPNAAPPQENGPLENRGKEASGSRIWKAVCCGVAAILLVWVVALQIQLAGVRSELALVRQIAENSGGVITIPQTVPDESELTDWSVRVTGYDRETEMVSLRAEAAPKTFSEGASAQFCVQSGGETVSHEAAFENGRFSSEFTLSAETGADASLYLLLNQNGESRNIYVQELGDIVSHFRLVCSSSMEHATYGAKSLDARIAVSIESAEVYTGWDSAELENWQVYPVRGAVKLYVDGVPVETRELDFTSAAPSDTEAAVNADSASQIVGGTYYAYFENIVFDANASEVWFEVEVTDNYGRVYREQIETPWSGGAGE